MEEGQKNAFLIMQNRCVWVIVREIGLRKLEQPISTRAESHKRHVQFQASPFSVLETNEHQQKSKVPSSTNSFDTASKMNLFALKVYGLTSFLCNAYVMRE